MPLKWLAWKKLMYVMQFYTYSILHTTVIIIIKIIIVIIIIIWFADTVIVSHLTNVIQTQKGEQCQCPQECSTGAKKQIKIHNNLVWWHCHRVAPYKIQKREPCQLNNLSTPFPAGAFHLTQPHPHTWKSKHGRNSTIMPCTMDEFKAIQKTHNGEQLFSCTPPITLGR